MANTNKKNFLSGVWQKITSPIATKSQLQNEVATPTGFVGTSRPTYLPHSAANMTPERMVGMLDSARNGFPEEAWALFEYIEEADPELRSLFDTRKRTLTGKRLIVEATGDDALSQEVADVCRQALALDFVPDMLFHMLDAISKSFSVQEMVVNTSGKYWMPAEVISRPIHFFRVSRDDGQTILLKDAGDSMSGTPLEVGKYIVHKPALKSGFIVRNGLGFIACWLYLLGTINLKDWISNAATHGKPFRLGRYSTEARIEEVMGLKAAMAMLGSDAYAVLPKNMEVELLNAASTGNADFFEKLSRYLGELKAKLILGQTKSSDGNGGSLALAKAHLAVMESIVIADAQSLVATLRRDYLGAIVRWNFGHEVPVPGLRFHIEDPVDAESFANAIEKMVNLGMEIEASVVRDRLGLPDPKPGAKLLARAP